MTIDCSATADPVRTSAVAAIRVAISLCMMISNDEAEFDYTAGSAATSRRADSICVRRIGRNTNQAISAAIAFMMLAVMKTACHLPVLVCCMLDKGARRD